MFNLYYSSDDDTETFTKTLIGSFNTDDNMKDLMRYYINNRYGTVQILYNHNPNNIIRNQSTCTITNKDNEYRIHIGNKLIGHFVIVPLDKDYHIRNLRWKEILTIAPQLNVLTAYLTNKSISDNGNVIRHMETSCSLTCTMLSYIFKCYNYIEVERLTDSCHIKIHSDNNSHELLFIDGKIYQSYNNRYTLMEYTISRDTLQQILNQISIGINIKNNWILLTNIHEPNLDNNFDITYIHFDHYKHRYRRTASELIEKAIYYLDTGFGKYHYKDYTNIFNNYTTTSNVNDYINPIEKGKLYTKHLINKLL
jgi:hypothetical protein